MATARVTRSAHNAAKALLASAQVSASSVTQIDQITKSFKVTKRKASSTPADKKRPAKKTNTETTELQKTSRRIRNTVKEELKLDGNSGGDEAVTTDQLLLQATVGLSDESTTASIKTTTTILSNTPTLIIPKAYNRDFALEAAIAHLVSIDSRFTELAALHPCEMFSEHNLELPVDPFESLGSSIISQQISGAAARSIKRKFLALFNGESDVHTEDVDPERKKQRFPTPGEVLQKDVATLRTVGFSQRKSEYILDLASKFHTGEINPHALLTLPDEQVIELLTKIRGLGVWSAEMFLIFALKRQDVFSIGDLGVQRGMALWYGKNIELAKGKKGKFKYMSEAEMVEKSDLYRPYRSLFTWYMWRAGDVVLAISGDGDV
ncbi:DNA glycosylase [Lipomyces doorenjongii]|uniref:DNA glycosylase n=1 Tax=Lipomyces doorenjongii TaxID=383834 RepID=UPI0034CD5295